MATEIESLALCLRHTIIGCVTEIAKEKIEFRCASRKPVTEYLRRKAHQH